MIEGMSLGLTPSQPSMFATPATVCAPRPSEYSIYSLLHREGGKPFGDELFADLHQEGRRGRAGGVGRPSPAGLDAFI
jgi:hypothetical protein